MSATTAKASKTGANAKKTITIRMKRSKISCNPKLRATVNGLGLKQPHDVKTLENTPSVRGMIKKVLHLVEVVSQN